jgi:hypothetical protein
MGTPDDREDGPGFDVEALFRSLADGVRRDEDGEEAGEAEAPEWAFLPLAEFMLHATRAAISKGATAREAIIIGAAIFTSVANGMGQ